MTSTSTTETSLLTSREFHQRWCGLPARAVRALMRGVAATALVPALAAAQHPLLMLPLDDPAYVQLQALDRAGCAPARVSPYRPFFVRDIRRALLAAHADPTCRSPMVATLLQRFGADTVVTDSIAAALVHPGAVPDTGKDAFIHYRVSGDSVDQGAGEQLGGGGMLTLRATALHNGDFWPYWQDVKATTDGTPPLVGIARGRVRFSGGARFLAVAELYGQSSMQNDPTVRAKSLRHTKAFLAPGESYLNGRLGPITISAGRSNEAWLGEGRESLILSANGPMMDRLVLSGTWKKVQGRAVYGALDDVVLTTAQDSLPPSIGTARMHRAIVGHALSWEPTPRLELTAGETMLFSRRTPALDWSYMNPLMPYVVAQNDTGRTGVEARDNVLLFGGARAHVGPALLAGEMLVDDIQVDAWSRQRTSDQLGFALRGSVPLPAPLPVIADASYTRIWPMTYSRDTYSEVYQFYGAPLGSELGPDADMLTGELELWPSPTLRFTAGGALWRHGATRLDRRPAEGPNFHGLGAYPSTRPWRPDVQEAAMGHVGVQLLTPLLPITARVDLARITNVNNLPSAAALYVRGYVQGSYALRYP